LLAKFKSVLGNKPKNPETPLLAESEREDRTDSAVAKTEVGVTDARTVEVAAAMMIDEVFLG